jgi:3-dehydrosphinganine reductase
LPAMVKRGSGQLCFISSLGGLVAPYGYSAYSASKFAVLGMAEALRQELYSAGIGVTVVCPPEVDTPMVEQEAEHILPQTRLLKDLGGTLQVGTVTRATVNGIARNRRLVIPGLMGKLTYLQFRLMPGVAHWVIRQIILWLDRRSRSDGQ